MHISIPKPCHEDWTAMTPNEQGRHCNVCCKTVVDFTGMNDEDVKYFFIKKKKEAPVCGRFKNEQLQYKKIQLPYNIHSFTMPLWKRFLTACLLAFSSMLFSCGALIGQVDTMGETTINEGPTNSNEIALPAPSPPKYASGVVMLPVDTNITKKVSKMENNICENPSMTTEAVQSQGSNSTSSPGSKNDSTSNDGETQKN